MGNIKSKKVKISQNEPTEEKNNERINTIKTEIANADVIRNIKEEDEDLDHKDHDNASSASTVEVLDENNAAAGSKKQPAEKIKLYYFFASPPCRAVLMAAKMLGIEFELISVNLAAGEHLTPEFLKMNPQHTVPTINDNGFILWESRAIMTYLVNAYGKNDELYPKNARLRALVDQRLQFDLSILFTRFRSLYMPMIVAGESYDEEEAAKLKEALGWLNGFLENRVFVAGDNFTVADISMVVTMTNLEAFGFDYKSHENVVNWFERSKKILKPYGYKEIDEAGAELLASLLPE